MNSINQQNENNEKKIVTNYQKETKITEVFVDVYCYDVVVFYKFGKK